MMHPIFPWLREHCADVLNKGVVGPDGRTAWERVRGRAYHGQMLEFASKVMFRVVGKVQGSIMTERWYEGLWLGKTAHSDEHLVMKSDGAVVRSRAVRELDNTITIEDLNKLKSEPHDPSGTMKAVTSVPRASVETAEIDNENFRAAPRRVRLTKEVVDRFGPTPKCVKCRAISRDDPGYATYPHSAACRKRLEGEMVKDDGFKQRLEQAEERRTRYLADYLEKKVLEESASASGRGGEPQSFDQSLSSGQPQPQEEHQTSQPQSSSQSPQEQQDQRVSTAASTCTSQEKQEQVIVAPIPTPMSDDEEMGVPVASEEVMTETDKKRTVVDHSGPDSDVGMDGEERNVRSRLNAMQQHIDDRYTYDVVEIFSPPRVCERARAIGLRGGYSLDIAAVDPITSRVWDLSDPREQTNFERLRKQRRAHLLVATPPCRVFRQSQNLRKITKQEWEEAVWMLRRGVEACQKQHREGHLFLMELPRLSEAIREPKVQELMSIEGVFTINLDQCQYGLIGSDGMGTAPALGPTTVITNMKSGIEILGRRCRGGHRHVHDGRASARCQFPTKLADDVLKCLQIEIQAKHHRQSLNTLDELHCEEVPIRPSEEDGGFYDDLTWEPLDARGVKIGREKELAKLKAREVYELVPRSVAAEKGANVIKTRWVQHQKGQDQNGEKLVKCRFVGMEFANDRRDDLFAGTPPLWAARLLVSKAASRRRSRTSLMVMDVASAFLYADVLREIFIELPREDTEGIQKGMVGRLRKALYGTRDAPLAWQEELSRSLNEWGFKRSKLHPALFTHIEKGIDLVIHVDDMLCSGTAEDLEWFAAVCRSKYEVTRKIIQEAGEELSYLGRKIRKTIRGFEWEADPRHLDTLMNEWGMKNCNEVGTPTIEQRAPEEETEELMGPDAAKRYRRAVARINYMSQDRPDLSVAATYLARSMAKPRVGDDSGVKRVIRYLAGHPHCIWKYDYQEEPRTLDIFTDSDWAGCRASRRSTSGGVVMHGRHAILHWSKLQANVALSSGEAELNSQVKGAAEGLGVRNAARDLGMQLQVRCLGDSSAAKGILTRVGVGKMKHLEVKHVWVQELVRAGEVEVCKVPRANNPGDVLTHPCTRAEIVRHMSAMGMLMRPGTADRRYPVEGGCSRSASQ